MDPVQLFTVEEAFQISGRGCVLAKGIPVDAGLPDVRVGDQIRLVKPNGDSFETRIHGMEILNYGRRKPEKFFIPILLPTEITKDKVPPGTCVFLIGEGAAMRPNSSFKRMPDGAA